jgi:hypothetical protein
MGIRGGLGNGGKKGKWGNGIVWMAGGGWVRWRCVGGLGIDGRQWNGVWRWLEVREMEMRGRKIARWGEKWGKEGEKVT